MVPERDLRTDALALVLALKEDGYTSAEAAALCAAAAGYITGLLPAEWHEQARKHLASVWERHRRRAVGEKAMAEALSALEAEGRA